MSDYISREKLSKKLAEAYNKGYITWGGNEIFKEIIAEIQSADVRENIHGTWEEWKGNLLSELDCKCCSNCNHVYPYIAFSYKFCPNCGADMRGD